MAVSKYKNNAAGSTGMLEHRTKCTLDCRGKACSLLKHTMRESIKLIKPLSGTSSELKWNY